MASIYQQFLQSPSAGALSPKSSINYITTTTTISEPAAILKHFQAQQKQVSKKEEKVLSIIESQDALCLETETTLEFKSGGGAYLPQMDENLLDERIVTFPIVHVVTFDGQQKIQQIRLYWDQGTLLKQVEAIGRTGRNWPIRDGKAQVSSITNSLRSAGHSADMNGSAGGKRGQDKVMAHHQKRSSMSTARDHHEQLSLFDKPEEEPRQAFDGPAPAPRQSAKPAPRDYGELFAGDEPAGSQARSPSPAKTDGTILKAGAGKQFKPSRLFDENEEPSAPRSPERKKTYGQKYEHFTFGDGEDANKASRPTSSRSSNKHGSHFSFEDFSTPPKVEPKMRPGDERHWGAGVEEDDPPSPPKRPIVHAARPDAKTHFQFTDDSPAGLTDATNTKHNKARSDQEQHYSLTDASPANATNGKAEAHPRNKPMRNDMQPHWSFDSPVKPEKKIYKTAGDGMGGRRAGVLEADELSSKRKLELTPSGKENIRPSPGKRIRQSEVDELLRGVPAPAMVIDPSSTRKDLFSALKAKRRVRRATFSSGTTTDNDPDL